MQTYLTPEPIICEIRNAAGEVVIELADVSTTTVDVLLSANNPLGFLDDMLKAVNRWGSKPGGPGVFAEETSDDDPTERVKIDFRPGTPDSKTAEPGTEGDSGDHAPAAENATSTSRGVLIVDTEPARGMMRNSFVVRITAPLGSSVRARTESADVGISGTVDRLEIRSGAGSISTSEVSGRAVVQTASGNVTLPRVHGDLDLRVVSGRAEVGAVGGRTVIASTSGDVHLDQAATDVDIRTVSGAVEVRDVATGTTEIAGVSGNVTVGVHPGSAAKIDLSTMSGNASSDFSVADTLEGAALVIKIKTVSGDIRLRSAVTV